MRSVCLFLLFLLFLFHLVGGCGCFLHKVLHVLLSLCGLMVVNIVLIHFWLGLDTLGHLFVVSAGRKSVLGRRDRLAKLLILEVDALNSHERDHRG